MTHMNPSIGILHNLLENYECMLSKSEKADWDIVVQANMANFHQALSKGNENFKGNNVIKVLLTSDIGISLTSWNNNKVLPQILIPLQEIISMVLLISRISRHLPLRDLSSKVVKNLAMLQLHFFLLHDVLNGKSQNSTLTMSAIGNMNLKNSGSSWLLNSSATHYVTSESPYLTHFMSFSGPKGILGGNGSIVPIYNINLGDLVTSNNYFFIFC